MIASFVNKQTRLLYQGESVRKWEAIRRQAERRLQTLDMATCLEDLQALPSNRFEVLKGKRKHQCSIRINRQWRICFH